MIEEHLIKSLKLNIKLISFFKHPKESRFINLFKNIKNHKKKKGMKVCPKDIMLGKDQRTSIIIKNIPEYITEEEFKQIIIKFSPNFDFFYIPNNIITRKKLRVAFINVLNCMEIVPIFMGLIYRTKFIYKNQDINIEICYSKVQGKDRLIQRFFQ